MMRIEVLNSAKPDVKVLHDQHSLAVTSVWPRKLLAIATHVCKYCERFWNALSENFCTGHGLLKFPAVFLDIQTNGDKFERQFSIEIEVFYVSSAK